MDSVRAIADAVLYEGYILWPYRRSALKNQRRWTFGGVYPRAHAQDHPDDPCVRRAVCLLEHDGDAWVDVAVRFLHVVERRVAAARPGGCEFVDELTVAGERHLAWDEAAEREVVLPRLDLAALRAGHRCTLEIPPDEEETPLEEPGGRRAGAIVRRWAALTVDVEARAEPVAAGVERVVVAIANATPWRAGSREAALRRTCCSAHAVLRTDARFVSRADPPAALRDAARQGMEDGLWPVLVGPPGARDTVLASPIILEDHPRIAPESPGDLFDGGEVDQLLVLNILSLTDEEKAEMRASDPRAREILERTEALRPEDLMRLHGAIREFALERPR